MAFSTDGHRLVSAGWSISKGFSLTGWDLTTCSLLFGNSESGDSNAEPPLRPLPRGCSRFSSRKDYSVQNRILSSLSVSSEMAARFDLRSLRSPSCCLKSFCNYHKIGMFPGSSTVERSAVNQMLVEHPFRSFRRSGATLYSNRGLNGAPGCSSDSLRSFRSSPARSPTVCPISIFVLASLIPSRLASSEILVLRHYPH